MSYVRAHLEHGMWYIDLEQHQSTRGCSGTTSSARWTMLIAQPRLCGRTDCMQGQKPLLLAKLLCDWHALPEEIGKITGSSGLRDNCARRTFLYGETPFSDLNIDHCRGWILSVCIGSAPCLPSMRLPTR